MGTYIYVSYNHMYKVPLHDLKQPVDLYFHLTSEKVFIDSWALIFHLLTDNKHMIAVALDLTN